MRACAAGMLLAAWPLLAAEKPPVVAEMADENVAIKATLYTDPQAVTKLLGLDPGFPLILVHVKFAPRGEQKIPVWRDDFTILSHNNGERSQPLSPTQLAGKGTITVNRKGYTPASGIGSPGGIYTGGPWGTGGRPGRIGATETAITQGSTGGNEVAVDGGAKEKDSPLLTALKQKVLPEKETNEAVEGYLYFLLDGKQKAKDLELIYKPPQGDRIFLNFGKDK